MRQDQRLINTGAGNPYLHAVLIIVTVAGLLYVTGILPAYDPAVLAAPDQVIFLIYMQLAIAGLIVYVGMLIGLADRINSLNVQLLGILGQSLGAGMLAVVVVGYGGWRNAAFLFVFSVVVCLMHLLHARRLLHEIGNASLKVALAKANLGATELGGKQFHGDLVLQTLQFLHLRNVQLQMEVESYREQA